MAIKPDSEEAQYFRRAREVIGSSAGAIAKKLLIAKGSIYSEARAVLEKAAAKGDPKTYVLGAINHSSKSPNPQASVF